MALDMFIDIEGVPGESIDEVHKGHISLLAWSWGASQNGTTHLGPGGGAGKVNVQDLSFTKYVDSSSHLLLLNCCNGTHIPKATLTIRKAGGASPLDYQVLTLSDIIVSSISTGGSGGEDRLTENVTLNFAHFKFEYTKQKKDGGADGGPLPAEWNIPKNAKVAAG
jgi:type VI secretion system secreted protein Hcp